MSASASGWLLRPIGTPPVAVGVFELAHVMPEPPERFVVPGAPAYARQAVIWNDGPVPLLDLSTRVADPLAVFAATRTREFPGARVAVVRYLSRESGARPAEAAGAGGHAAQEAQAEQVEYGAVGLLALPERIEVRDDQARELPGEWEDWRAYTLSCFEHTDGTAVPIVQLERLFGAGGGP